MSRVLVSTVLLTAVYALVLATLDPWDLAAGALLSLALLAALRGILFHGPAGPLRRLPGAVLGFVLLAAATVREIVAGTWQVALIVLHVRPLATPGIVAVPIGERTRLGTVVSGWITSLAPGEYLVDVDWDRRVMLVHTIDARDPEALRARHARFYDRYQRRVFP